MEIENKNRSITGVILAGGKSHRMGQDKALLEYRGKPFIQHIAEILKGIFDKVIIISDDGEKYNFINLPIYSDIYKNCGPLAGIHAALKQNQYDIFVTSCDTPVIEKKVIQTLLKISTEGEIFTFSINKRIEPFPGIYKFDCLNRLESEIDSGNLSVQKFIKKCKSKVFPFEKYFPISKEAVLKNINTPNQYKSLLKSDI
ncbi:MAG: molybdenum cofactor guanylyltransferase [Chlorobiaceae bacterium]|nr:molybdenum cofactor guanylyltransferase [Chlorobiaceae bacterium]